MPERYHIPIQPAPPRFKPVGQLGIVDWREDCAGCHNCVKRGCVYGFYKDEAAYVRERREFLDYVYQCKGCLTCVQNCTKQLLTRAVNPDYERLGDEYYTPAIVQVTWFQAETGRIPVSGAGYRGPFSGSGFDAMWTDMSEIVRPTRDGIHGREYISTLVDIGRKVACLQFEGGRLVTQAPPLLQSPMPLVIDWMPALWASPEIYDIVIDAADRTQTWAIVPEEFLGGAHTPDRHRIIPLLADGVDENNRGLVARAQMVEVRDGMNVFDDIAAIKQARGEAIVGVRVEALPGCADRVVELATRGVEAIHLVFDSHGRERIEAQNGYKRRHARAVLREIHRKLLERGVRDEVTLISSGGVALAEHMAKAVICGADLVAIDLPVIVALECRLCRECERGEECPVDLDSIDREYGARRVTNLLAAWHSQLLEVMGAMGMREVRRLRGETGRAMFREDLEREVFAPIFGRK